MFSICRNSCHLRRVQCTEILMWVKNVKWVFSLFISMQIHYFIGLLSCAALMELDFQYLVVRSKCSFSLSSIVLKDVA